MSNQFEKLSQIYPNLSVDQNAARSQLQKSHPSPLNDLEKNLSIHASNIASVTRAQQTELSKVVHSR
jgi:hypothetical protein